MNEDTLLETKNVAQGVASPFPPRSAGPASAVSWAAIFAGAAGAAALSLILLILGVGLGLSSVSPWSGQGATATVFGTATIVWVTVTQLVSAGTGGYLAGRLRTRWMGTHTDEVYFRDTAHGFLAWAIATLVTAAVLTSAIGSILNGGVQAGASMAPGAASTAANAMPALTAATQQNGTPSDQGYFVDGLFRKNMDVAAPDAAASAPSGTGQNEMASSAEAGRIFASAIGKGQLLGDDSKYLGQLVTQRTGIPQAEAEKRVTDAFGKLQTNAKNAETAARNAADKVRKASAYSALWLFVSLLVGAFCASLAATYGGRQRDLV